MVKAKHAGLPDGEFRPHAFELPEKLQIFERIAHEWAPHLGDGELRLLLWLARQTVSRGKRSGYYWLKQITHGIGRRGGGEWAKGSGLPDKSLRRAIAAARTRGVLHTEETERGTVFAIVLDWNPETCKATKGNVVPLTPLRALHRQTPRKPAAYKQAGGMGVDSEVDESPGQFDRTTAVNLTGPYGQFDRLPRVTPTNQDTYQEEELGSAAPRRAATLPEIRKRVRPSAPVQLQTQSRPGFGNEETTPRCAAPPPPEAVRFRPRENGLDAIAAAGEKRAERLRELRTRMDAFAYEGTWTAAWAEAYPGQTCGPWTMKTAGMLKKAVARWPESALGNVHGFLEWTVRNWDVVCSKKLATLKVTILSQPEAEFVARFISAFQETWADKEELRWLGTLPTTQQAVIALMRRQGISEDVALALVMADQASARDRAPTEKLAAEAKRDRDATFRAVERANSATRFTTENPHPRAHENAPFKPNMIPGEPSWQIPDVFFDESKI